METGKRERSPGADGDVVSAKKARGDELVVATPSASASVRNIWMNVHIFALCVLVNDDHLQGSKPGPKRTSSLAAPIMLLTGHGGEVFTSKFSPDGMVRKLGAASPALSCQLRQPPAAGFGLRLSRQAHLPVARVQQGLRELHDDPGTPERGPRAALDAGRRAVADLLAGQDGASLGCQHRDAGQEDAGA